MKELAGLPQAVRQAARELLDGELEPVPLRDAATVALLRDGPSGLEVFMQRRAGSLAFASGMHVFPGGRVDEQDLDPAIPFSGRPPDPIPFAVGADLVRGVPNALTAEQAYRGLLAAAVRETLEEAGVLLAVGSAGAVGPRVAARVRGQLLAGASLADALREAGLAIDYGSMVAIAHWITPAVEVRRFDTRFFAAALPSGQEGASVSAESDAARWIAPDEMLRRFGAGEAAMLPPTVAALMVLSEAANVAQVLAAGHRAGLRPVLPHPFREGGEIVWRLIDGYTGEPLEGR